MYQVVVERKAEKDLDRLSEDVYGRVRVGDYRIIYEIADALRIVRVTRVRHRREVYR